MITVTLPIEQYEELKKRANRKSVGELRQIFDAKLFDYWAHGVKPRTLPAGVLESMLDAIHKAFYDTMDTP